MSLLKLWEGSDFKKKYLIYQPGIQPGFFIAPGACPGTSQDPIPGQAPGYKEYFKFVKYP